MSFQWPLMLLFLLLIPVLIAAYIWMQRWRQRYAVRYARLSLVKEALGRGIISSLSAIFNDQPLDVPNRSLTPPPQPTPVPKGTYAPAIVVLLTDGENNQGPDPEQAAELAADRGVRIYTVGVGSEEGT